MFVCVCVCVRACVYIKVYMCVGLSQVKTVVDTDYDPSTPPDRPGKKGCVFLGPLPYSRAAIFPWGKSAQVISIDAYNRSTVHRSLYADVDRSISLSISIFGPAHSSLLYSRAAIFPWGKSAQVIRNLSLYIYINVYSDDG